MLPINASILSKLLSRTILAATVALIFTGLTTPGAFALITGGEGNTPIDDPGWPKGAEPIFNHRARIAFWEGPPLGGGEWHSECRGDTESFNAVLQLFARLDVQRKKLVVHDGVGHSFWLNPNNEPDAKEAAKMDWAFLVWHPESWQRLRQLPADLNPTNPADAEKGPPSQIDVYTGGNIQWADVKIPEGIEVDDRRLESHGFTVEDGIVLEGNVVDLQTNEPLAALAVLEKIEPQPTGGYKYPREKEIATDADGHWVLKNAPSGWFQIVISAEGYVPRVIGYAQFDGQPSWNSYDSGLARPGPVSGRVTDVKDNPLADASVRLADVVTESGVQYATPQGYEAVTDANGNFRFDMVPIGSASVWLHKPGYCRIGLGKKIKTPANDLLLEMLKSSSLVVTIDFSKAQRPEGYIVEIEPEGGTQIGSWGGSGHIDEQNQITFNDVPPGRYVLKGRPNPGGADDETDKVTVDLRGGETQQIDLIAK